MTDSTNPAVEPPLTPTSPNNVAPTFILQIVGAAALGHLLNDLIQAGLPAVYPMLKVKFALSFGQIGLMAMVYQITASLLQPWIGLYTDKHPKPYLLPLGMCVTLLGIGGIALANNYAALMVASAVIGVGSATFHPEASRVARMASGGRFSLAQSIFQVGGNSGAALGPLFVSVIILPIGQAAFGWLAVVAIVAIAVLFYVARWRLHNLVAKAIAAAPRPSVTHDRATVTRGLTIVSLLMFAKFIYIGAITNYRTFYLIA